VIHKIFDHICSDELTGFYGTFVTTPVVSIYLIYDSLYSESVAFFTTQNFFPFLKGYVYLHSFKFCKPVNKTLSSVLRL